MKLNLVRYPHHATAYIDGITFKISTSTDEVKKLTENRITLNIVEDDGDEDNYAYFVIDVTDIKVNDVLSYEEVYSLIEPHISFNNTNGNEFVHHPSRVKEMLKDECNYYNRQNAEVILKYEDFDKCKFRSLTRNSSKIEAIFVYGSGYITVDMKTKKITYNQAKNLVINTDSFLTYKRLDNEEYIKWLFELNGVDY